MRTPSDGSFDDEQLSREGGVFVSRTGGREVGPEGLDGPPSDYPEDPDADDGVPGTRDDLPYDYGLEDPEAADHLIEGPEDVLAGFGDDMGATEAGDDDETPLGAPDERELWHKQRALSEEAEAEEGHLRGIEESDVPRILDAEAEGAEEAQPDFPEGESATGAT